MAPEPISFDRRDLTAIPRIPNPIPGPSLMVGPGVFETYNGNKANQMSHPLHNCCSNEDLS